MSLFKTIGKTETVRAIFHSLIYFYIRLAYATGRWEVVGEESPNAYWRDGKPFIGTLWHNRIAMIAYAWPDRKKVPINFMVSSHRDGQIVSETLGRFGMTSVPVSSKGGGSAALRVLLKAIKKGESACITPDGPRGPRYRAKAGIVGLAKMSGVPIIPVACGVTRRMVLNSWDRLVVPLPFARGVFVWGEPIEIDRDADEEEARLRIEQALTAVTTEADRLCGHGPLEPGEAL